VVPIDSFLESFNYIGIEETDVLVKNYNDVYFLLEGYERVNPVTMKKGKLNYLDKMFEHDILTKEEHTWYTKKVLENEPVNIVELYHDNKHKDNNHFEFNPYMFKETPIYNSNNIFNKHSKRLSRQTSILFLNFSYE
jgi:hypothetical protein